MLQEIVDEGPAFDLLYRELWRPGVQLTAALIARIEGKVRPNAESHVEALMLHASLTAFSVTRPVSERYLDETARRDGSSVDRELAVAVLDARIDRLGAAGE